MKKQHAIVWGVELSPFVLKLQACLQHAGITYRRLPCHGKYSENTQTLLRLEYLKRRRLISRYPEMDSELDEYPAVPFFSEDGSSYQYDSSSIALYLDQRGKNSNTPLFPTSPAENFIATLIDEAFDEFGLYMVHHMRWVGSARSNIMGKLLAREFKYALPPGGAYLLSKQFPRRQVSRCPYLFSVAPKGFRCGVSRNLTPPSISGFPETHSLLYESWKAYLQGMEHVLSQQAYLLGEQFTIADASAYGQLAMNLVDPETAEELEQRAPKTFRWLNNIYHRKHVQHINKNKKLYLSDSLTPLLNTIMGTFSSLMVQNYNAHTSLRSQGQQCFNEPAFNRKQALFEGKLRGYPFKAVVKTFQVRVWNEICEKWRKLDEKDKEKIDNLLKLSEIFSHSK